MSESCILSIDPGTEHSGWVLTQGFTVLDSGNEWPNDQTQQLIHTVHWDVLLIEEITVAFAVKLPNGRPGSIGKSTLRTQFWAGVFFAHGLIAAPESTIQLLSRSIVSSYYRPAGRTKAKDADVSRAVRQRYHATGGGASPHVGTKGKPGPLFGVSGHAWQALGNTVFFLEKHCGELGPTGYRKPEQTKTRGKGRIGKKQGNPD